MTDAIEVAAAETIASLRRHGVTVATAESMTGGLVSAALTSVAGASSVFRGGIVAYATSSKAHVVGVDRAVLDRHGAVAVETAVEMAAGCRRELGADIGLATTGVAGPDSQDGHPPGTVFVAIVAAPGGGDAAGGNSPEASVTSFTGASRLEGSRGEIRSAAVVAALSALRAVAEAWPAGS
ncbi:nicotinamide-nucleotide amidohydrolase family protein [Actinobacteria bacterium YIM 96077]|uniref:Damage-inducible protein CinA n=1 Tax=Phytoactinopolyspora halophila TaxID=1981511 RepID=A0A329QYK2_9ACTN|nr:nicotinamide-nucleotide amidohydrolase family protein [Phytoactinopolyspora halophila]AYY12805.1 nicotinamide-nucleotide amidohydrolase family protein [Actinobacteria bacterium YIM 96077]RAW16402.1 damage-inducible protein CinA [Phytoactinopolyspora halophila]